MGTGSFLSFNTGDLPHSSITGLYPIVAWKIRDETVFFAEAQASDTATVIDWCRNIGLFDEYDEINDIVSSVKNSQDVFFVPAFSGIQVISHFQQILLLFLCLQDHSHNRWEFVWVLKLNATLQIL